MTNTIAIMKIRDLRAKKFYNIWPRDQYYKTFLSLIYGFSYEARVFVRLDQRNSLVMTNKIAITKIRDLRAKKFYNIWPRDQYYKTFLSLIYGFSY
jgi:retron-type reverse transcriptase